MNFILFIHFSKIHSILLIFYRIFIHFTNDLIYHYNGILNFKLWIKILWQLATEKLLNFVNNDIPRDWETSTIAESKRSCISILNWLYSLNFFVKSTKFEQLNFVQMGQVRLFNPTEFASTHVHDCPFWYEFEVNWHRNCYFG